MPQTINVGLVFKLTISLVCLLFRPGRIRSPRLSQRQPIVMSFTTTTLGVAAVTRHDMTRLNVVNACKHVCKHFEPTEQERLRLV